MSNRSDVAPSNKYSVGSLKLESCDVNSTTGNYSLSSMEKMVHDPLSSGFLLKFCEAQYCAENVSFVIEVDRFRDYFRLDKNAWPNKKWRTYDLEYKIADALENDTKANAIQAEVLNLLKSHKLIARDKWPSSKVDACSVEDMVTTIWNNFISDNAPSQICMPSGVLLRTMLRLQKFHVYGQDVFQEMLEDPMKTIVRDIQPRFKTSDWMLKLRIRVEEFHACDLTNQISIPPPPYTIHNKFTVKELKQTTKPTYTLADFLGDKILYSEFLRHLNRAVCSENLRFIRALAVYAENINSPDAANKVFAVEFAWKIFRSFIAVGSLYEISVSDRMRHDILRDMAQPMATTFQEAEKITMDSLKILFEQYKSCDSYQNINTTILEKRPMSVAEREKKARQAEGSFFACFGV